MVVNKVGSGMYYIIVSLILGLMILTISLFWIFGEYFGDDEIDWQVCRQSILLRASLPEADLVALKTDVKGAFPLKCKTEVVTIDSAKNLEEVYKKISDAVVAGWYMFGEGKLDFIHRDYIKSQTLCMAFARIHFDENVVREFSENSIDGQKRFINYYRSTKIENSKGTYDDYLPIYLEGEPSEGGNLVVNWGNVSFSPEANKDYLLVYRINKVSGFTAGAYGGFLTKLVPSWLVGVAWTDESVKSWQGLKTVAITSVDSLDVLRCDKFLTIPA